MCEDLLVFDRLKTHVEIQPEPADGRVGGAEVVGAGYRQLRRRGAQHQVGAVLAAPAATFQGDWNILDAQQCSNRATFLFFFYPNHA